MAHRNELSTADTLKQKKELKQLESDYLDLGRELNEIKERGLNSSTFSEHTALFRQKLEKADKLAIRAFSTGTSKCISMDCELLANISSFNPQLTELVETDTQVFSATDFAKKLVLAINPSSALADVEEEEELASQNLTQLSMDMSSRSFRSHRSQRSNTSFRLRRTPISSLFSIEDLRTFGQEWATYNNESPTYDYILGSFEAVAPARVERSQRQRIKHNFDPSQRQKPAEAKDDEVRDVVTQQVENLYDRVHDECEKKSKKSMPMFEALLDPSSFSHTVSNLFHSAFLVKSGSIGITRDLSGKPMIEPLRNGIDSPLDAENDTSNDKTNLERKQSILSFNKEDWAKWIQQTKHN